MKMKKPRAVPSRDEKYMAMAMWAASFSKDPDTQVGAFIIDSSNRPLGWGYNGPPSSIRDEDINWERPYKYDYVEHAEENAIDFSRLGFQTLDGSILYVTARPCKKCMLKIVKNKINKVVFFPYKSKDPKSSLNSHDSIQKVQEIAKKGNVDLQEFEGNLNWIRDRVSQMELLGVFE